MGLTKVGVGAGDSRIYKRAGSGSGASSDSFKTISTSSGTSPVADSATDTLTITGTAPIVVTGDSTTDTVTISTTSATVPAPTTIYDHFESADGSTWSRVQHLTLNTSANLYFRAGTTKYLSSDSATTLDVHIATSDNLRFYEDATLGTTWNSSRMLFPNNYIIQSSGSLTVEAGSGGTLSLKSNATTVCFLNTTGTAVRFSGTNEAQFNASTEKIYSSTSGQLDITSAGLIKSHAVTEIRDVINSNTARSVTTSEHRWYISGNDNLYLDASVGSGKLGYYTGAVTTAYATWSSATWQLINANNSGVMNITASGTSAEINVQATSNMSVRIAGTDEYFLFSRAASGSDYKSRITFSSYDADAGAMADAGYIDGLVSFAIPKMGYNVGAGGTHVFAIGGTDVLTVSASIGNYAMVGNTTGTALYLGGGTEVYIMIGLGSIVANAATSSFYYSGSTFNIGGNSASGRTLNLNNGGIGSFTCNIVSSTEWSFTSTELTVGSGNHIYIQGGGQSRYRDTTTYVYSSATNTLDLVVSSSSRAVLTAGALTMGSATAIICAAATTSIPSIRVPAGTAPSSPTEGDVWNDSTQKCPVHFTDGIKVYGGGIIYSQVTNTTIANTTSETTLATTTNATGTLTLPANWWTRGKVMRVTAAGVFSTKSGTTPTGRIRLLKGSTELCTSSAKTIPDIGGTSRLWTCVIYVTGLSTAFTSVMSQGTFQWINASVSVGAAHVFEVNNQTGGVATAVTIGATSEAIDLKWTWGTADALDTITCTNLFIEVIA